jgi:hypothetical protein
MVTIFHKAGLLAVALSALAVVPACESSADKAAKAKMYQDAADAKMAAQSAANSAAEAAKSAQAAADAASQAASHATSARVRNK